MTMVLAGMFNAINAQNTSNLSDEALSAQYKHEINVLNSQIKTLKLQLKTDKENGPLKVDLAVKQAQLKELKNKKSVIDDAIKSKNAAAKAAKKANDAQRKAEQLASDAQKLKEKEEAAKQKQEPTR